LSFPLNYSSFSPCGTTLFWGDYIISDTAALLLAVVVLMIIVIVIIAIAAAHIQNTYTKKE